MKKYYGAIVSVLWAATSVSMAQNPVPYVDTYESYATGSNLVGTVWQGASGAMAVVSNGAPTPTQSKVDYPVPAANHTKVMAFSDGTITNEFDGSSLRLVAFDTMIKPVFSEPPTGDQLIAVSNSQISMYIGTNGLVNIWHGTGDGWTLPEAKQWSVFPQMTITASNWIRVTMTMSYLYDENDTGAYVAMFKTAINGVELTNSLGKSSANPAMLPNGGPWFKAGVWTETDLGCRFHKVVLSGSGMLDDMVVATNNIAFNVMVASNGAPIAWMQAQGLTTNVDYPTWDAVAMGDQDNDGAATWAEYIAGTAPTNETSKLVIVSTTYSNGAPILKWIGTTNALYPYLIQWSSNLMSVSSWMTATNLPQTEGTNTVTLPAPTGSKAFIRVNVPTP